MQPSGLEDSNKKKAASPIRRSSNPASHMHIFIQEFSYSYIHPIPCDSTLQTTVGAIQARLQVEHHLLETSPEAAMSAQLFANTLIIEKSLTRLCRDSRDNRDSGRPQRDSGNDANPGNNLHIAGLAARTRESDLEEIFGKFGKVS